MFLKICGIRNLADASHAVEQGATALGFVLWPRSPRYVARDAVARIVAQLPATITTVGVFVNESSDEIVRTMDRTNLTAVQLHGDEPAAYAQLAWPILRSVTLATAAEVAAVWSDDAACGGCADSSLRIDMKLPASSCAFSSASTRRRSG